ncbi:MAG TPA: hypothetical protein PLM20_05800 [Syntrophomonadaceae bacterium]|nr:hypothetical protein [Syntrophomonadaceae bacterium]HQE23397.1 hypothetical protein [Syntrophomonadaceae bacterium]
MNRKSRRSREYNDQEWEKTVARQRLKYNLWGVIAILIIIGLYLSSR